MSNQEGKKQKPVPVSFRLDPDAARTLEGLADRKGLTRSDFIRGIVEKILVPIGDADAATAAAIEALPPGARAKALRAVAIQKRLRELRSERPKVHALSALFQDGSGADADAETVRLEAELETLGKAFEAEVVGSAAPIKRKDKKAGRVGLAEIHTTDEDEEESVVICDLCGKETPFPDVEPGEVVDFNCAKCGGELKSNETDVWPAADGDEPPDDGEGDEDQGGEEDEADDESEADEPEESSAEKEAGRFLALTGKINALRDLCEARTILNNFLDGGPPACNLLLHALERGRGGDLLDDELYAVLGDVATRSVAARTKIQELKGADSDAAGPLVKRLEAELKAHLAKLTAALKEKKIPGKKSGFWD